MLFYRFKGRILNEKWEEECEDRRAFRQHVRTIAIKSSEYNESLDDIKYYFVSDAEGRNATIGLLSRMSMDDGIQVDNLQIFLNEIGLKLAGIEFEEVTFDSMCTMLRNSQRGGYIDDMDDVLCPFGLDLLYERYGRHIDYGENIIDIAPKRSVYAAANRFFSRKTLLTELDRIYVCKRKPGVKGHPVHYLIQTDDRDARRELYRTLLTALYANGRIRSKRYSYIDIEADTLIHSAAYDYLYQSCDSGAVVVRCELGTEPEDDYSSNIRGTILQICETLKKYQNDVLTILCLPRECTDIKELIYSELGYTSVIEIKDDPIFDDEAKHFLRMLAKDAGLRADTNLFKKVEPKTGYLAPQLKSIFDEWYNHKLKNTVYPQYSCVESVKQELAEGGHRGSAYDELQAMIGLEEVKKTIDQALAYYKAQKLFSERGLKREQLSMHMVFSGNPGTAKTTVARLLAKILKDNDILSRGQLVEVGRGDLVGKYVGWTAPTIQKKFKLAEGGVLFIDEAYSLVDDRDGSFGDEAINTIVQEMENHRKDVVVIFAGYPDKMEQFLNKNPGLRSRIAFHVPFSDYDTESLCKIAGLIARNSGLTLSEDACKKLHDVFDISRLQTDFGNGRHARNIIEKARMAQAQRLLSMDISSVKNRDLVTICAEDIELPEKKCQPRKEIGFCA